MPEANTATVAVQLVQQATDRITELEAAGRLLKARLSAGLSMEQALVSAARSDPAYKLAVELWFGMDQ